MSGLFDRWLNSDGLTVNGVKLIAGLTGLPEGEVAWTHRRLLELMRDEGKSREEAIVIVQAEREGAPWRKA